MKKQNEVITDLQALRESGKKVPMRLVGINGNAFAILGKFQRQARKNEWDQIEVDLVTEEATSGDYNKLLSTIMEFTSEQFSDE